MEFGFFFLGGRMRGANHHWLSGLIFVFLSLPVLAATSTAPAHTGAVNTAVGGVIDSKLRQNGFASNDPRITATTDGISAAATTIAAGVATGGVAAVGWPALLAAAGISAVVTAGVPLARDKLVDWLWGDNQTAALSGADMGSTDSASLPALPASLVTILDQVGVGFDIWYRDSSGIVRQFRTNMVVCPSTCWSMPYTSRAANFVDSFSGPWNGTAAYWSASYYRMAGTNQFEVVWAYTPRTGEIVTVPAYATRYKPIVELAADIPPAVLSSPLSDRMIADTANTLWQKASQINPQIVPWSATNPITPTDVSAWRTANPTAPAPTVADFVAPIAPPNTTTVPIAPPSAQPAPAPVSPGQGTQIDLGPDPNTPAPRLESTPTINNILDPILGLLPGYRTFSVPAHSSICPTYSVVLLGSTRDFSAHCALIESNRSIIAAVMVLVWTLTAAIIILRA